MTLVLNRSRLIIAAALLAGAVWLTLWLFNPERMLERAWAGLIDGIEARQTSTVRGLLAEDYGDRWGYDRATLAEDLRFAFFHFKTLRITADPVHTTRTGDRAEIRALVRLEAQGTEAASGSVSRINRLEAPFVIEWHRAPRFPWGWRIARIDHPAFEPAQHRGMGS